VNKILVPLAASAAVALLTACGGKAESTAPPPAPTPVATSSTPTSSPSPKPVVLTRANFGQQVQATLKKQGTYRMVIDATAESGQVEITVKAGGSVPDISVNSEFGSVVGVSGRYYYQDSALNDESGKWVRYNPKAKGLDALTSTLIKFYIYASQTTRLLAGTPYATKFAATPGPVIDRVPTTQYAMVIDLKKAAAAKVYGDYLTSDSLDPKQRMLSLKAVVGRDGLLYQLDLSGGGDKTSIAFSNFGDSVFIAAPAPDQIKR
jgi:hypothetical protein